MKRQSVIVAVRTTRVERQRVCITEAALLMAVGWDRKALIKKYKETETFYGLCLSF